MNVVITYVVSALLVLLNFIHQFDSLTKLIATSNTLDKQTEEMCIIHFVKPFRWFDK